MASFSDSSGSTNTNSPTANKHNSFQCHLIYLNFTKTVFHQIPLKGNTLALLNYGINSLPGVLTFRGNVSEIVREYYSIHNILEWMNLMFYIF